MILVGSADSESHSLNLGRNIKEELNNLSHQVELINLVDYGLPLYDRKIERENSFDENVRNFLDKSLEMDAFVWITPIYHNSYSAILKNALDWHHSTKFPGRVVGLASNGGNRSPQAADHLSLIARSQNMITIPTRVCTDQNDYNENLVITNEDIKTRINRFCNELVEIAQKIK